MTELVLPRSGRRRDALLWAIVAADALAVAFFLLRNLDRLSLWMDEGFHWLAVNGILSHGIPLFPSGHVYYKAILYCYVLAGAAKIFGFTTATLRAVSVLSFAALIPVAYAFAKKFAGRAVALGAVAILSLSAWGIEYARAAVYFAPLQPVFLAAILLFWVGYVEDRKGVRPWAWLTFALIPLVHQLGVAVWFCFPALLLVRGLRRVLKKDVLLFGGLITLWYAAVQLHEFFFWKVGYVYERTDTSIAGMFRYFFSGFSLDYAWQLERSFFVMSKVVFAGLLLAIAAAALSLRAKKGALSPESRWLYMNALLVFPVLMLGFFRTHVQPRYLTFLYPLFVVLFLTALDRAARLLVTGASKVIPKKPPVSVLAGASLALFVAAALPLVEGAGWSKAAAIVGRKYQDRIRTDVIARAGRPYQEDYRTTGEYVRHFLRDGDAVVAIHVVFGYIYAGRVDYWLWTGGPGTWDAWEKTPTGWRDFYIGARWLNSLQGLKAVIEADPKRRVWVITSPSLSRRDHIKADVEDYIRGGPGRLMFVGQDGESGVYLFNGGGSGPDAAALRAFEGEWAPNPPGRIVFRDDASRGAALEIAATPTKAKKALARREFAATLPGDSTAGRYRLTFRLAADGAAADDAEVLTAGLCLRRPGDAAAEKIRTFVMTGRDLGPAVEGFREASFDAYLGRPGRVELRIAPAPGRAIVLDSVDLRPAGKE